MNWEAIGAIGEIVGALAVVTTLLYLSVQIRQHQRSSIAEGSGKGHELHSVWRNTIVQNTDAAGALAKANSGENLSERERVQLELVQKNVIDLISPDYGAQVNAALAELKSGVVKADS